MKQKRKIVATKVRGRFVLLLGVWLMVGGGLGAQDLVKAIRGGDQAEVADMLKAGADPDELESWGNEERTPLMVAADQMDPPMIRLLLKAGARANFKTPLFGRTALMHCVGLGEAYEQSSLEITGLLLASGAKPSIRDANGMDAVMWAVEGGSPALLGCVLAAKPDLSQTDSLGESALHRAAKAGQPILVGLLMKAGGNAAQLQAFGRERLAPLHMAVDNGDLDSAKAMLDAKANVNCQTKGDLGGQTPMHRAVSNRDVEMVKLLLDYKPNLAIRDDGGETARQYANQGGGEELGEIIGLLVKAGAP